MENLGFKEKQAQVYSEKINETMVRKEYLVLIIAKVKYNPSELAQRFQVYKNKYKKEVIMTKRELWDLVKVKSKKEIVLVKGEVFLISTFK